MTTTTLTVGQRITAGSGDDRDTGTVAMIDGDQVTVQWDQGIVTTQPVAALVSDEQDDDDDLGLIVEVCETRIQYDASGQRNWKPATYDDCPANIRQEIECEMLDGGLDSGEYVASNGVRYRW